MSARIEEALIQEAKRLSLRLKDQEEAGLRRETYNPARERSYLCPACWVLRDEPSLLDPIPAGKQDVLACEDCGAEFLV